MKGFLHLYNIFYKVPTFKKKPWKGEIKNPNKGLSLSIFYILFFLTVYSYGVEEGGISLFYYLIVYG